MTEYQWLTAQSPRRLVMPHLAGGTLVIDSIGGSGFHEPPPRPTDHKLRCWVEACRATYRGRGYKPPKGTWGCDLNQSGQLIWAVQDWSEGESPSPTISRLPLLERADLARHIIGNPFRHEKIDALLVAIRKNGWPAAVVRLAEAVEEGENCAFALHDALLEAGHPDLADHFAGKKKCPAGCAGGAVPSDGEGICERCSGSGFVGYDDHPRGCWVLDLILRRE